MVQEELNLFISELIREGRKAPNWETHLIAEAKASVLEEMKDVVQTMLEQEILVNKKED